LVNWKIEKIQDRKLQYAFSNLALCHLLEHICHFAQFISVICVF
jgi:hypothetical protein